MKIEEKLSKGWGGENAYHVGGYRYLLVDGDRNVSRASPATKVTTLTKVDVVFWHVINWKICYSKFNFTQTLGIKNLTELLGGWHCKIFSPLVLSFSAKQLTWKLKTV